jgi:hypothetical protein
MNSSKPSGQAQTVVSNDPWEGQQPYLEAGFKDAEALKNNPMQAYPNSSVVPFSNQTTDALAGTEARARAGSPLLAAGQNEIGATASGSYLGSNPYLDDVVKRATDTAGAAIDSRFTKAGRYGSGHHANAVAEAGAGIGAQVYGQEYGNERGRMMEAAKAAPGLANADYTDLDALGRVGGAHEAFAGAELGDQMSRYAFEQQAPRDALKDYMALIGGGSFGGTQTSTQPLFSNPWAQGLGMAGTAAGIAGDLWGRGGAFANG